MYTLTLTNQSLLRSSVGNESACNSLRPDVGDVSVIPESGRFVRKVDRNNPLQYYLLENPNDRGARQTTVHGVARVRHDLVTKPPIPPPVKTLVIHATGTEMARDVVLTCFRQQALKQTMQPHALAYSVPSAWTPHRHLLVLSRAESSSSSKAQVCA